MGVAIGAVVKELQSLVDEFQIHRTDYALTNQIYEAATYWVGLARWISEGRTNVDFVARAREEMVIVSDMRVVLSRLPEYALRAQAERILALASNILERAIKIAVTSEGHWGVLTTIRRDFSFLRETYRFEVCGQSPIRMTLSNKNMWIELGYAQTSTYCCTFGREPDRKKAYWPEDLLFLHSDARYLGFEKGEEFSSAETMNNWFSELARILLEYGPPIFVGDDAAFARLEGASTQRDAEFTDRASRAQ